MRDDEQDVTGVESLVHVHHGDARFVITRRNCRLDGRGAAMPRQKGGVQVQAREPRNLKHGARQDLPVRHHDDDIWCERTNSPRPRPRA